MLAIDTVLAFSILVTIIIWRRYAPRGQKHEAVWGIAILWLAAALGAAVRMHLPIPVPTDWIAFIFAPVYRPIVNWLKKGKSL